MKATELRIGNLVQYHWNNKMKNVSVYPDLIKALQFENSLYEPIPLTEEWLLKFGFEFYEGEKTFFNDSYERNRVRLNYREDKKIFYWEDRNNMELKYVHQLQNLYFALTGEELETH